MKKTLSIIAVVVIVIAAGVAWFVNRTPSSPFDNAAAQTPSDDLVSQGEYVARLTDCVACHSTPGETPFAGGLKMATPLGAIFATNITPDKQNGIGDYTLADFDRAVRKGVARDGHRLYPAMPYPSYAKLSDDDVRSLYAFFRQAVKPANQPNKQSEIPAPLNMRWPLALWNVVFTDAGTYRPTAEKDAAWNRGAYLVQGAGHCGACHTPRGPAMEEKALDESSPLYLSGAVLDGWYAPSLRGDPNRGLGRWNEDDIYQFLKSGRNQHAVVFGSMVDAYNNSTQFMSDGDLKAIAHYLKSLPGNPDEDGTPWTYKNEETVAFGKTNDKPGAATFMAKCSFCHGPDGRGQNQWIPPLAGATSSLTKHDVSQINVVLNGSGRVVDNGVPDAYRMPPFRQQLSDREIADVLSFVRSSWGNNGAAVKAEDVKDLRQRTNPASSDVIILQMR